MQKDLQLVARIVGEIDGRLAQQSDAFLASLRLNIEKWHKELYRCWLLEYAPSKRTHDTASFSFLVIICFSSSFHCHYYH